MGETGREGLDADLGDAGGFVFVEVIEESFLGDALVEREFLFLDPLLVTAAGGPIGNVAKGDAGNFEFLEGDQDALVGHAVGQHVTDHIADVFGQARNAAVTAADVARPESGARGGHGRLGTGQDFQGERPGGRRFGC